jgi:hypothetical protein
MRQNIKNLVLVLPNKINIQIFNSRHELISITTDSLALNVFDDIENKIIKVWVLSAKIPIFLYSGNNYQPLSYFTDEQITQETLNRFGNDLEFKLNSLLSIR